MCKDNKKNRDACWNQSKQIGDLLSYRLLLTMHTWNILVHWVDWCHHWPMQHIRSLHYRVRLRLGSGLLKTRIFLADNQTTFAPSLSMLHFSQMVSLSAQNCPFLCNVSSLTLEWRDARTNSLFKLPLPKASVCRKHKETEHPPTPWIVHLDVMSSIECKWDSIHGFNFRFPI